MTKVTVALAIAVLQRSHRDTSWAPLLEAIFARNLKKQANHVSLTIMSFLHTRTKKFLDLRLFFLSVALRSLKKFRPFLCAPFDHSVLIFLLRRINQLDEINTTDVNEQDKKSNQTSKLLEFPYLRFECIACIFSLN